MKNTFMKFMMVVFSALTITTLSTAGDEKLDMINVATPAINIMTGGQPSLADLEHLKADGVKTVISLRGLSENAGFDEIAEAKKLGINFIQIPISSALDLNRENAIKLDELIKAADGQVLVHCKSSNRVGALLALREFYLYGKTAEQAMAFGRSGGMKSLERVIAEKLK